VHTATHTVAHHQDQSSYSFCQTLALTLPHVSSSAQMHPCRLPSQIRKTTSASQLAILLHLVRPLPPQPAAFTTSSSAAQSRTMPCCDSSLYPALGPASCGCMLHSQPALLQLQLTDTNSAALRSQPFAAAANTAPLLLLLWLLLLHSGCIALLSCRPPCRSSSS
jgi:hypothetical protein